MQNDNKSLTKDDQAWTIQSLQPAIDYLVASTQDDKVGQSWYTGAIQSRVSQKERYGRKVDVKEWSYKGFHGHQALGAKVGYNDRSGYWLFWSSGNASNECFETVAPKASKVARMDLCVTACFRTPDPSIIEHYYSYVKNNSRLKVSRWHDNKYGDTLYVGSMHSGQFGRVYFKDVQMNQDTVGKLVRYEVVFRDRLSTALREEMLKHRHNDLGKQIAAIVKAWFVKRGVGTYWQAKTPAYLPEVSKRITADDRKLEWLRTSVKPTLLDLLGRGYQTELEGVLGVQIGQLLKQTELQPRS